jgi:Protein of unknown function (DUF1579)
MKRTMMLLVVALLAVSAMAQEKPAAKAGKPTDKKAPATQGGMPPAAKPSPEMQKMAKMLVGKWTAVTKTEPMGGMPGGEAKGEATFYRGPGGLSLIEDFKSQGGGFGNFRGHGVTYWDDKAKNYTGVWCDSMTPGGCSSAGTSTWEGDKIVGFMEMPDEKGQVQKYRMTYSDIKPDSVTFTMEAPDGGNYKPMMTIVYTRAAGATTPAAKKD